MDRLEVWGVGRGVAEIKVPLLLRFISALVAVAAQTLSNIFYV
jgi:hypothetical protein